ncbi:MAG TPA: O-antigen ligase family protein, partial [Candidatus Mcinerneyibacteriales bacterium]|nr:O-antigen ligase family protein [Candidatus Mcinerneyibacteriales bacterium]
MKLIKRFGRSDILFPALIGASTFLNGGEHFAVKYLFPVIAALFCLFGKERRADTSRIVIMGSALALFFITLTNGILNTDSVNFLIFTALLLYITTLTPEKPVIINVVILTASLHAALIFFSFILTGELRQASTFVNANWAAVWLAAGLYFLLFQDGRKPLWVRGGGILLLTLGIVVTLSRTGFMLLFILLFLLAKKAERKMRLTAVVLLLILLVFLSVRVARDLKDPLAFSRGRIYAAAAEMFSEKPLFGYGIAVVDDRLPGFSLGEERVYSNYSVSPKMAHSIYLESLLSFGIIGTLLLGAGIIPMLKKSAFQAPFVLLLLAGLFNNIEKSFSLLLLGALFLAVRKEESIETRRGVS